MAGHDSVSFTCMGDIYIYDKETAALSKVLSFKAEKLPGGIIVVVDFTRITEKTD